MADRISSQKRGIGFRKTGERILVVCEGQTEVNYLNGFKRTLSREKQRVLKIEPVLAPHPNCVSVLNKALDMKHIARSEGVPYQSVWIFFDDDNQNRETLQNVFARAQKAGIEVAYSSISFTFWFLLHFKTTSRVYGRDEDLEADLKKEWVGYAKPTFDSWANLEDQIAVAIGNAKWLRQQKKEFHPETATNPFTNVDVLLVNLGYGA